MASNCPHCGKKLKFYDIKAECSACGTNIPNYNWEARLEEDHIRAEAKFSALYKTLNMLKYSVFGTKLRIVRIIMSFIPAIGFILPWAYLSSDNMKLNYDLLGLFTDGESTIKFFGMLFGDLNGFISAMSAEGFSGAVSFFLIGLVLMLLGIIVIVAAFFLIFIKFKKPKTKATFIADLISIVLTAAASVLFILSSSAKSEAVTLAGVEFTNIKAGVLWGVFVYIALLCVAFVANLLVSKADVKSEEELEAERLERVRIKEEKAEAERIKKEKAWAEEKRKAEEEEAEKIRKAREALDGEN